MVLSRLSISAVASAISRRKQISPAIRASIAAMKRTAIMLDQRFFKCLAVDFRVVRLEMLRGPVTFERHPNPVDDLKGVDR